MRIRNVNDATVVSHQDVEYHVQPDGSFEVPAAVGRYLTSFPQWVHDVGQFAEHAEAAIEADVHDRLAAALARIEQLEADLAKKPAKTAAKKTAE